MHTRFILVILVVFGGLSIAAGVSGQSGTAAPPQTQKPAAAPAGNAANGRKIFNSYGCYQCHGYEAQGSVAGPRLGPRPIAFVAFSRYLRQPTGQMPPYTSKVVSDAELADIYAFLWSRPEPPELENLPLLR